MKRLLTFIFILASSCGVYAQAVDTTVCAILQNPQSFNGKIVRIQGTVEAGFDQFVVKGTDCGQLVNDIWLSYPEGTKAKAGPAVVVELQPAQNFAGTVAAVERTPVQLDKGSKDFKQFDSLLAAPYKGDGVCLGCQRSTVTATLVGRLDGATAGLQRDKAGKIVGISGFGNMNAYSARLVLQSVSDVAAHEIDYSKSAAITKGDALNDVPSTDPVADAHLSAKAFGPNNPMGDRVERAAAAFPQKGDKNGVLLSFGAANLAIAKDEAKSDVDSPDGVLYNVRLNMDRLKGVAPGIAIAYAGTVINDIRDPKAAATIMSTYDLEYYALQSTVLGATGNRLKTLTLPGGYIIWNRGWTLAEQAGSIDAGIKGFLGNEELLTR
jgi:hypothetical protein